MRLRRLITEEYKLDISHIKDLERAVVEGMMDIPESKHVRCEIDDDNAQEQVTLPLVDYTSKQSPAHRKELFFRVAYDANIFGFGRPKFVKEIIRKYDAALVSGSYQLMTWFGTVPDFSFNR